MGYIFQQEARHVWGGTMAEENQQAEEQQEQKESQDDAVSLAEKFFLAGIGAAEMTRVRFTELADELIKRGQASQSDARKMTDWMAERASEQQEAAAGAVSRESERAMRTFGVATSKDVEELRAQIADLKAMLAESRGASADEAD